MSDFVRVQALEDVGLLSKGHTGVMVASYAEKYEKEGKVKIINAGKRTNMPPQTIKTIPSKNIVQRKKI